MTVRKNQKYHFSAGRAIDFTGTYLGRDKSNKKRFIIRDEKGNIATHPIGWLDTLDIKKIKN